MNDYGYVVRKFVELYGGSEEGVRVFTSPGRVNLIGEHTDYNGGYVFPAAIEQSSIIALRRRDDGNKTIRLAATDLDDRVVIDINDIDAARSLKWGNYQAGVAYILRQEGYQICPCDILYHDEVPLGSGLSSSAAIEVVMALALATLSNETNGIDGPVDMIKMAKLAQRAENVFCGVSCGIMDQFASAMGRRDNAIFLDCNTLDFKYVPLVLRDYKIIIGNTKKKRSLAEGKYNERCAECKVALEQLRIAKPGAECLRDFSVDEFEDAKALIQDDTCRIRAEHVIYECDRVLKSVQALRDGNLTDFGKLMTASHISLRDLYEVTGPHLDCMVEQSLKVDGCIGSRMTGAGFGGCTVSIVKDSSVDGFIQTVGQAYTEKMGIVPEFYVSDAADGAREIKLG